MRAYIGAAIAVALVAVVAVSYSHYSSLVSDNARQSGEIAKLKEDVAREQGLVEGYRLTVDKWEAAAAIQAQALADFSNAQREAGVYQKALADVISKHDLGALAKRKPGLVENRVNAGSDRVNRLLESATGANPAVPSGAKGAASAGAPGHPTR